MSQYLPFWPKAAMSAGNVVTGAGNVQNLYTRALPTNGFTEVVAQVALDTKVYDTTGGDGSMDIIPQVSNDGINWEDSSTTFTAIDDGTSVPHQETIKVTEIAAFMRVKVKFSSSSATASMIATLQISGVGRS